MKTFTFLSLLLCSLFVSGCASVFCDSTQNVRIMSEPSGANFRITTLQGVLVQSGKTPASVFLRSGESFKQNNYKLFLEKPGYENHTDTIKAKFNPVTCGNCILGGLCGLGIDLYTGSFWKHDNHKLVYLQPLSENGLKPNPSLDASKQSHLQPAKESISTLPTTGEQTKELTTPGESVDFSGL